MGTDNLDELEMRNGGPLPPTLQPDATHEEMVKAINGLALELQFIREAFQEQGTRIEMFCTRIERALGVARSRTTDPAPAPKEES
jgi:hypothetical protein